MNDVPKFFIVGHGRSGTVFLHLLLNLDPRGSVFHEMPKIDRNELVQAYWMPGRDLVPQRKTLIQARIRDTECEIYGEVNSYLRHHAKTLQQDGLVMHLVRDPRAVVRSVMERKAFSSADAEHSGRLTPRSGDWAESQWDSMSRFERVCWYWQLITDELCDLDLGLIRFEDITSSYELFREQVLVPTRLHIDESVWNEKRHVKRNKTQDHVFPHWNQWTENMQNTLRRICGKAARRVGYEV